MPVKLGKSHTTVDRATKKVTTVHPYIKNISKTELIEKYNNEMEELEKEYDAEDLDD